MRQLFLPLSAIVCALCLLCLNACSDQKTAPEYEYGSLKDGQEISDLFDLQGEPTQTGVSVYGSSDIWVIYTQQTTEGGWVAWTADLYTNSYYAYTDSDVDASRIRMQLAIHLSES